MPEAAVHETTVQKIVDAPQNRGDGKSAPRGARADAVVVTGENFNEFVSGALGKGAPEPKAEPANEEPGAKAAKELKALEDEKARRAAKAKEDAGEDIDHPEPKKKGELQERFGKITADRKAAEAKAKAAEDARVAAEQEAQAARAEAQALKAKYEPAKPDELGPEPQPAEFQDVGEYAKAIKDWTADKTRREDAAKAREEARAKEARAQAEAWERRVADARKEIPDYDKKLSESKVLISDQMRDAIIESEVGPQLLVYLADNPGEAAEMGKLSVGRMLRALGKLEAALAKAPAKDAAPQHKVAEIARPAAPAPIEPIQGTQEGVVRLRGSDAVPAHMTYEDWKAARKAGRIQ